MDSIQDYNAWLRKRDQQNAAAASSNIQSSDENPDEVADNIDFAHEYARVTGNPAPSPQMVQENRDLLQRFMDDQRNKVLLSTARRAATWYGENPMAVLLAKDDVYNLCSFEHAAQRFWEAPKNTPDANTNDPPAPGSIGDRWTGVKNSLLRSGYGIAQMFNQYMMDQTAARERDRKMSFNEILESQRQPIVTRQGKIIPPLSALEYFLATTRYLDARYADLIGTDDDASSREYALALGKNLAAIKALPKSAIATAAENSMFVDGASLQETIDNIGSAIRTNPGGVLSWVLETTLESTPQIAAVVGATAITRNPTIPFIVGRAATYATERYTSPADFFEEKGFDLSKPEDVERFLHNPALLKEATERGVIRALTVTAFDTISGGLAGKLGVNNPVAELTADALQGAITSGAGEYTARKLAGQETDWNEVLTQGLSSVGPSLVEGALTRVVVPREKPGAATAPTATPAPASVATTPMTAAPAASATPAPTTTTPPAVAPAAPAPAPIKPAAPALTTAISTHPTPELDHNPIRDISMASTNSLLHKRSHIEFHGFAASVLKDTPAEYLHVPVDALVENLNAEGTDLHSFVDGIPGMNNHDADVALATGSAIKLSTAAYATDFAGGKLDPFFQENSSFDPRIPTAAEAKAKQGDVRGDIFSSKTGPIAPYGSAINQATKTLVDRDLASHIRGIVATENAVSDFDRTHPFFSSALAEARRLNASVNTKRNPPDQSIKSPTRNPDRQ